MYRYQEVEVALRRAITDGTYPVGSTLPPVSVLAQQFHVAPMTVRQALHQLRDGGLIALSQGALTRVVAAPDTADATAANCLDRIGRALADAHIALAELRNLPPRRR